MIAVLVQIRKKQTKTQTRKTMEQQNQLEINKKVEEQEQSVEQVLSTLGNAFRQTEDQRTKRIEQFKHIILKQYPSSKDYVENRENIISALFNGYCTPEERSQPNDFAKDLMKY